MCSGAMNSDCSFLAMTGGRCGSESKHRSRSVDCVLLLSCKRDISAHKSAFTLSDFDNEVYLTLSRASIFCSPANIYQLVICPAHRAALGIGWRRSANERCRIPVILLHHSDDVLRSGERAHQSRLPARAEEKWSVSFLWGQVNLKPSASMFSLVLYFCYFHSQAFFFSILNSSYLIWGAAAK